MASKYGALDRLRSCVAIVYSKRGKIAMAITVDDMPEVIWSVDNSRISVDKPSLVDSARRVEVLSIACLTSSRSWAFFILDEHHTSIILYHLPEFWRKV